MTDFVWAFVVAVALAVIATRLSAVRPGVVRTAAAGLAGVVAFGVTGHAIGADGTPPGMRGLAVMAVVGVLTTSVAMAAAELLRGSPHRRRRLEHPRHPLGRWRRSFRVTHIAMRHGLSVGRFRSGRSATNVGPALSAALVDAGGVFVKLGQVLATRPDLVTTDIAAHLESLHDDVPSRPFVEVEQVLEAELGELLDHRVLHIDPVPVAAGSLAQVHRAVLHDGRVVAMKVQRKGIADQVVRDLEIVIRIAERLERTRRWARELNVASTARSLADAMNEELDFRNEAANATLLHDVLARHPKLDIAEVDHELTTSRVLVTGWVDGSSISRLAGTDLDPDTRRELADALLGCMLDQLLVGGTFHADPHPGNVIVGPAPSLTLVDLGSVGRLDRRQTTALRDLLMAVDRRDPSAIWTALRRVVIAAERVDDQAIERSLGGVLMRHVGPKGLHPGLFGAVFSILRDYGLVVEPMVAGALRSFMTLDGTLRVLSVDYDIVERSREEARSMLAAAQRTSAPSDAASILRSALPLVAEFPRRLDSALRQLERGDLVVGTSLFPTDEDRRFVGRLVDEMKLTLVGIAAAVSGLFVVASSDEASHAVALGMASGFVGVLILLRVTMGHGRRRD